MSRDELLARVRDALRDVPAGERPEEVAVPRTYRRSLEAPADELCDRFAERVSEYRARVRQVPSAELRYAIQRSCDERAARRVVIPAGLPDQWRPAGIELIVDEGLSAEELDSVDGVLTGCAAAIAETGTIVLDAGPSQGRRAITLIPDLHLCVVERDQIVGSVPEGLARVAASARDARRPVTLVSGPSATSDIELRRVEGVHGPRQLEVLIAR